MADTIMDNKKSTPRRDLHTGVQQTIVSVLVVAAICAMFEVVFFARVVCPQVKSAIKQALDSVAGSVAGPNTSPLAMLAELADHRERRILEAHNRSGFVFGTGIALLPLCLALVVLYNNHELRTRESITDIAINVVFVSTGIIAFQLFFYQFAQRYRYTSLTANISKVLKHYEENNAATCAHGNFQLEGDLKSALGQLGLGDLKSALGQLGLGDLKSDSGQLGGVVGGLLAGHGRDRLLSFVGF
jgi:hypothetical protein